MKESQQSGSQIISNLVKSQAKIAKLEKGQFLLANFQVNHSEKKKKKQQQKMESILYHQNLSSSIKQKFKDSLPYQAYLPLNKLWNMYTVDLLSNQQLYSKRKLSDGRFLKILKADMHGAILKIYKSKVKSYEGIEGIVIRETLRTFFIITEWNEELCLLKQNSIFLVEIAGVHYKIYGCHLVIRPSDRIKYKFKFKNITKFILQC